MITLGINAAFHDSAAALVKDGQLIAAAEEERFTGIKHAKRPLPFTAWELPFHAIDYCLREAGILLGEVDNVAYSYDPWRFLRDRSVGSTIELPLEPSAARRAEGGWENPWDPLFASYIVNAPRQLAGGAPHHLKARFAGVSFPGPYRWSFVEHHICHQASAFLAAPFEHCAVMTLDGRGEDATTTYGRWRDGHYHPLGEVLMPTSLGLLYERITSHLGFLHSSDEYKVMALAALGRPSYLEKFRRLVKVSHAGRYEIEAFDPVELFGPARHKGAALTQAHFDLAASLQAVLEETVLQLAGWLREVSGERHLAMAGGVALNCVMNSRLRDAGIFEQVWVQPAAGDAGTALGAALWIDMQHQRAETGRLRHWNMQHAYWGPGYGDDEIEALLKWSKLPYRRLDDVAEETAKLLTQDRIIGWFQGRMEFGPRALGARSILASPLSPDMQARLNELKDREDFRPVAPVVPEDDLAEWFSPAQANGGSAPFMLFIYDVPPDKAQRIPAVCHADRTARVQTVRRDTNPRYYDLLKAFGRATGVPVLVNTSFNVRGEPIVNSPRDALNAFWSTPLDALVIGSFLLEKSRC
ncbi:carbamoyltransferase family protein [Methylibium rhizosphaerae]|uniref:carbamoyltransferase family protein n=1 Tax=Methylibium rhizosphaerae TaxID=2570323 RepID=UPI00112CBA5C|nr:carbamoyltransferase C-terminal domain-containing protein [Methylibium rhizosphaerae]